MFRRAGVLSALSAALLTFGVAQDAAAQQTVKIGAIYPLSGNAASAGGFSKAAIELAVDLINNGNPNLKDVPLADGKGLPGLGGAKIEVIFADNQGTPAAGQNQALRLITEEKVVALAQRKAELFRGVMDEGDLFASSLTADDIRGLLE